MPHIGRVTLVGAGPGAPGLMTLRGRQVLESADVVLYDRLVGSDILSMIPAGAQVIDVGKSPGGHPVEQPAINEMILSHATQGKHVVRLKGGDPYLFGRGAEELEAVAAQGIPFEVVPGVTSAVAVPAFAGIPVTHRDCASSVHIITGHARQGGELRIPYDSLVRLEGTLVFLMGVGSLAKIASGLIRAGMDPETPAALVENGSRSQQRQLTVPLSRIADEARAQGYRPPSVLVVGKVCKLSAGLNWHSRLPLLGVRVVVTRAKASAGELTQRLQEKGCHVMEFPCIRTRPLPVAHDVIRRLPQQDWIVLTSPVGAELLFETLYANRLDVRALHRVKFAAVGAKTAGVLRAHGILPDLVPEEYSGRALAAALAAAARPGHRVLLFRASASSPDLPKILQRRQLQVEDVAAYETLCESPDPTSIRPILAGGEPIIAAFTSASTVHGFARAVGAPPASVLAVCIGQETARAAREYGLRVQVSKAATIDSLVACIEAAAARRLEQ